jgi:type IV fimbrial biogenesis protein FimT
MITNKAMEIGFTLIELMVTLALVAILLMVAVPSITTFQRNAELTSLSNSLIGSINTARGEAMKRGRNAMIIPADGVNWSSGWIVFVDVDSVGAGHAFTYSTIDDLTIQTREAPPSYLTITPSSGSVAADSPPYMLFDSSGYSKTKSGGFGALTLSITRSDVSGSDSYAQTRRLKISSVGRVKVCKPTTATDTNCLASGS